MTSSLGWSGPYEIMGLYIRAGIHGSNVPIPVEKKMIFFLYTALPTQTFNVEDVTCPVMQRSRSVLRIGIYIVSDISCFVYILGLGKSGLFFIILWYLTRFTPLIVFYVKFLMVVNNWMRRSTFECTSFSVLLGKQITLHADYWNTEIKQSSLNYCNLGKNN